MQKELNVWNQDLPCGRKVEFRIGINLGDVIEDRGDIYGNGVNCAARLANMVAAEDEAAAMLEDFIAFDGIQI